MSYLPVARYDTRAFSGGTPFSEGYLVYFGGSSTPVEIVNGYEVSYTVQGPEGLQDDVFSINYSRWIYVFNIVVAEEVGEFVENVYNLVDLRAEVNDEVVATGNGFLSGEVVLPPGQTFKLFAVGSEDMSEGINFYLNGFAYVKGHY